MSAHYPNKPRVSAASSGIWGLSLIVAVTVAFVAGACGGAAPRGAVSRANYPAWPFLPASGQLQCDTGRGTLAGRQYVSIEFDAQPGIRYALNGTARDAGFPELDATVWNGDRAATLGLIEQGLELCPE